MNEPWVYILIQLPSKKDDNISSHHFTFNNNDYHSSKNVVLRNFDVFEYWWRWTYFHLLSIYSIKFLFSFSSGILILLINKTDFVVFTCHVTNIFHICPMLFNLVYVDSFKYIAFCDDKMFYPDSFVFYSTVLKNGFLWFICVIYFIC